MVNCAGKTNTAVVNSENKSRAAKWIDRSIIACLFLFAAFAPHSIAVTQTAWLFGMLFWVLRFTFHPRPILYRTPLDYALLGFFILTGLSAFLSYEPLVSIGKLRAASLFTIVYLVAENVDSARMVRMLALTLIASCMINVVYTAGERVVGRGVKPERLKIESPLYTSGARIGDTLVEVDGEKIHTPDDLFAALTASQARPALVKAFRHDWPLTFKVERGRFLEGSTSLEKLGIDGWSKSRGWRASGFFGHYVTYAEVLQLLLALALGLFVSLPTKRNWSGTLLLITIAGLGSALLLTLTRAPWLAFLISSSVILLLGTSKRTILAVGLLAIPIVLVSLFLLQQNRNVAFLDASDGSTTWRTTVWHEGFALLVSRPRHLLFGVGMDSIKAHRHEWGLFDRGRLPMGHMHSNLLQLALERGVPGLILWLALLALYGRMLLRLNRKLRFVGQNTDASDRENARRSFKGGSWIDRGIVLGALGGLAGFFTSGIVHYNWGDSEVVMIFYFIMGLTLALALTADNASRPA